MSQREVLLGLLREAGPRGVDNHDLIYRHGITRAANLVFHLKHDEHMNIETVDQGYLPDGRRRTCRYILHVGHSVPVHALPAPSPTPPAPDPRFQEDARELLCGCQYVGGQAKQRCRWHAAAPG